MPTFSGAAVSRSRQVSFTNNDLQLDTSGDGPQSISRTFGTSPGTTSVTVRYRFVTTEVPSGYFGSEFNDYFSLILRSQNGGAVASANNTMNGLGLPAFDFDSGAIPWRTVTLKTDPKGDVVHFDTTVANVGDGAYDSRVVIDFVAENKEQVQPSLTWNDVSGGLNLGCTVEGDSLTDPVTIQVYWASSSSYAARLGAPVFSCTVPTGTAAGTGGPVSIPGSGPAADPSGTMHLIAVASDTKIATLPDGRIDYGANADACPVCAGQASATITNIAHTLADQARTMFQNLSRYPGPAETNITAQLAIYAPPGDTVIDVFATQAEGLTLAQIRSAAAMIRTAMGAEILSQGPTNVSNHCANPTLLSVVDVAQSSFGTNGSLFRAAASARASQLLDENNIYHVELSVH